MNRTNAQRATEKFNDKRSTRYASDISTLSSEFSILTYTDIYYRNKFRKLREHIAPCQAVARSVRP